MRAPSRTAAERNVDMKPTSLVAGFRAAVKYFLSLGRKLSVQRKNDIQLCETLSLGEKRFLAVVLVEQQKFLVGGAGNSVNLLAKLPGRSSSGLLKDEVHLL